MEPNIVIELPGLPRTANGSHGHWRVRYEEKKKWKEAVCAALIGRRPKEPFKKIRATYTRYSSSEPDFDGLVHSFKPVQDGLVGSGVVIGDRMSNIEATYKWEKAPPKRGSIRIEVWFVEA